VSAGVVASSPLDGLGATRQLVSIATTLAVALVATVFGSRVLGWLLPALAPAQAEDAGDDGGADRDR
jgi:hypothetical protein